MANIVTTFDIKTHALRHAGELADGTSPYDVDGRILDYINRVYFEVICGGSTFVPELAEPWTWARAPAPGLLSLLPSFSGINATLTNGSASGTFSQAPAASLGSFGNPTGSTSGGWFVALTDRADVYRIATHTAGSTSFTLDMPYLDTTITTGVTVFKLDYTLQAGIVRLVEPLRVFQLQPFAGNSEGKIQGISPDELHRRFPLFMLQNLPNRTPTHFAQISDVSDVITIRINSLVSQPQRVEYEFVPRPAPLTLGSITSASPVDPLPLVPQEDRSVLAFGAAYWLLVDKEDPRQDLFLRLAQQKIQGMLLRRRREYEDETKDFARINPRQDAFWRPLIRSVSGVRYP